MKIVLFIAIGMLLLTGCSNQQVNSTPDKEIPELWAEDMAQVWDRLTEEQQWFYMTTREQQFRISRAIRELDNIAEIDETAILVNGSPISRRQIEISNIRINQFFGIGSLSENIISLIRDEVALQEARRLGLVVPSDRLDAIINDITPIDEDNRKIREARIEGLGITEEEYFVQQRENMSLHIQSNMLWEYVREANIDAIREEVDIRDVLFIDVSREFYERFVDELVENADIEILDPEIRELLQQ